jgi:hypothetical protein
MRRTWTLVVLGLVFGACGSDESKGTQDSTSQDTEVFMPDLVPVDLVEPDTTPDTDVVEVVEPPKPGEFGYECDEGLDCNIGWCIQTAEARICTRECFDSCPNGFECRLAPGTDALRICLPKFNNLCDPCRETTDCNDPGTVGNYCLSYGANGRFCGAACNADPDCPGGYVCRNVPVGGGSEAKQCVPADGAECKCSPLAKQLQKATTCFLENNNGKCEGTRFCLQSGLSMCDAATPFPESCNSKDDNCDGVTDEFPPDYVCEIVNDIGTCPGVGICNEGVETCSGTPAKLDNNCDGIDDDCDGDTDEEACNDGNDCTRDSCRTGAGGELICNHENDNTRLCDDGSVCTQVDKCQDGTCTGFNPLSCEDGNTCTTNTCDPVIGCLTSFNNNPCEDGNPCTVNDTCNQGVCVAGGPNRCDDNNECTQDSCQAGVGCVNTNLSNGSGCNLPGLGQCKTGQCQNGTCRAVNLQDGTGCSAPSSKCPNGLCNGGSCLSRTGVSCTTTYSVDLCQSATITGTCTASGECNVSQAPPGFQCPGCAGICLQCFGIQLCLPF